jgi:hypothetical protein
MKILIATVFALSFDSFAQTTVANDATVNVNNGIFPGCSVIETCAMFKKVDEARNKLYDRFNNNASGIKTINRQSYKQFNKDKLEKCATANNPQNTGVQSSDDITFNSDLLKIELLNQTIDSCLEGGLTDNVVTKKLSRSFMCLSDYALGHWGGVIKWNLENLKKPAGLTEIQHINEIKKVQAEYRAIQTELMSEEAELLQNCNQAGIVSENTAAPSISNPERYAPVNLPSATGGAASTGGAGTAR